MKRFIAALLAAFTIAASAAPLASASSGKDWILLTDEPCKLVLPSRIPADAHDRFYRAEAIVGGKSFQACFTLADRQNIYIIYDDGDEGILPLSIFSNKKIT